ncbi:MAG: cofactor assembly of complex C subunit B [Elainellaceae cyanobacterium]
MTAAPILSSTLLLTLLIMVGLVFFIRASTKERLETAQFAAAEAQTPSQLVDDLLTHFTQRAYAPLPRKVSPENPRIVLSGQVKPSIFLAVFLTVLAAIGLLCLGLVIALLLPQVGNLGLILGLLAPFAGLFYWRRSGRMEQIILDLMPNQPVVKVTGHRDELIVLRRSLKHREMIYTAEGEPPAGD